MGYPEGKILAIIFVSENRLITIKNHKSWRKLKKIGSKSPRSHYFLGPGCASNGSPLKEILAIDTVSQNRLKTMKKYEIWRKFSKSVLGS